MPLFIEHKIEMIIPPVQKWISESVGLFPYVYLDGKMPPTLPSEFSWPR